MGTFFDGLSFLELTANCARDGSGILFLLFCEEPLKKIQRTARSSAQKISLNL